MTFTAFFMAFCSVNLGAERLERLDLVVFSALGSTSGLFSFSCFLGLENNDLI